MNFLRSSNVVLVLSLTVVMLAGCNGPKTVKLLNCRDLSNWQVKPRVDNKTGKRMGANKWVVGKAKVSAENPKWLVAETGGCAIINLAKEHRDSWDIYSKEKFGDCHIELEVMVPKGSNSGIYVMGEYEIQIFDSFGKDKIVSSDMGAIYGAAVPPVNASKAPGQWQKYVIDFRAPRFDAAGNKIENAKFIKVELNGKVLHKDLEMPKQTPAGVSGQERPKGPIMFQGDHGPVAYRNIKITKLSKE
jgi:hypothetical protein